MGTDQGWDGRREGQGRCVLAGGAEGGREVRALVALVFAVLPVTAFLTVETGIV